VLRRSFKLRRQWYEQDIDLAHHLVLIRSMAEIAQVGDADVVDAKKPKMLKVADIYLGCGTSQGRAKATSA
jgi:hypothetical protein